MKTVIVALCLLLAAPIYAVIPMPAPEVPQTNRVIVEGFVTVARGWAWAGEQFAVDIEKDLETNYDRPLARLVFAQDRHYREAVRNDGFVVRVEGTEVVRGAEKFCLVESIRTVSK